MGVQTITIDEAEPLFRGRMGLIFGPGITAEGDFYHDLSAGIASKWGGNGTQNYLQNAQHAVDQGIDPNDIKGFIQAFLKGQKAYQYIKRISALKWSAVISLAIDSIFDQELLRERERKPTASIPTQVLDFPQPLPPKCVPIFKLLGNTEEHFVYTDLIYTARRPTWRFAVQDFADKVQGNPVVCLGLKGSLWSFIDLLSQMLSDRKTFIDPLVLVKTEFTQKEYNAILQLTSGKLHVVFVDAGLPELISRLKDLEGAGQTQPLALYKKESEFDRLIPFNDIVTVVNAQLVSQISEGERVRLLDLLFSPNLPSWDPFFHKLDFRRTIENQLQDSILKPPRITRALPVYALVGSAASGKTTIAKRLAYDLAFKGNLVFWFRRSFYPNVQTSLGHFFKTLSSITDNKRRVFFFIDDPVGLGSLSVSSIAASAQNNGIRCTFVVVVRTSDWKTNDPEDLIGTLELQREFNLLDDFDAQEIASFPNYLVHLNVFPDKGKAQAELANFPSRGTADTLGLLYWLLPKTRQSIEASIQEEYLRLGERGGLSRVIIGAYNKTSAFLKQAYAMAAVCDHYHTPLPVEVLVSALDISYREWVDAVDQKGPAWGLLYGEATPDGATKCYRPRNSVVTRTLIETINGGKLAHTGEVERLLTLLKACTGTSLVYREFSVSILVPCSKLNHLEYSDGLQLYDTALSALPLPDRTLVHQKGLWIKSKGNDPLFAKSVLETALVTRSYPYTDRVEADEHVHTSLAATILDAADAGRVRLEESLPEILRHLDHARSDAFFNSRAVHVQANLMLRLISELNDIASADIFTLLNQALDAVDSSLLVLKNPLRPARDQPTKDIEFLEDISGKLQARTAPLDELKASAEDLWLQFKRPEGFVIAARKMLNVAREKNAGSAYNDAFAYCKRIIEMVQAENLSPSGDLCAAAASIYYEWNVSRYDSKVRNRVIDWAFLFELGRTVLATAKYSGDPFYKFVCAVALVQQHKWAEAEPMFSQLRRARIPREQLHDPRAVLLDSEGVRKTVQGVITGDSEVHYLKVEEFGRDFLLSRHERWPRQGEIAHAYIAIAFAGPIAVQSLT